MISVLTFEALVVCSSRPETLTNSSGRVCTACISQRFLMLEGAMQKRPLSLTKCLQLTEAKSIRAAPFAFLYHHQLKGLSWTVSFSLQQH